MEIGMGGMKIVTMKEAELELGRLEFDVRSSIDKILRYVDPKDALGLSYVSVAYLPRRTEPEQTLGCYFEKKGNRQAYIEIYVRNLLAHLKSSESLASMLPIQELGLARTIYHEIGHHVRRIRTHKIARSDDEQFARRYGKELHNKFIQDNAASINDCFDSLESMAKEKGLDRAIIANMKGGWERNYRESGRRVP